MKITINKSYLKLPVSPLALGKTIMFYQDGKMVYDLTANIDAV